MVTINRDTSIATKRSVNGTQPVSTVHHFVTAEALNVTRNTAALRPFRSDEFGIQAASPSASHITAANHLILELQGRLRTLANEFHQTAVTSSQQPVRLHLHQVLHTKNRTDRHIKFVEKIWAFYFELFGQRQTRFADWLLAADRIAQDCYQVIYTGLGQARSIPTPTPFSYMETGLTPATFRRGVRLSRLGKLKNPFPIVKLPYHRLVNPWTLGAVLHEVSHNIQNDLDLWQEVPRRIQQRLHQDKLPALVVSTWVRWHKEIWADLCALLLGGPAVVSSLLGVVAQSPRRTLHFDAAGVHPTSYFRVLINLELLHRMGFEAEAEKFRHLWTTLYPAPQRQNIPLVMLETFSDVCQQVVDSICFRPYAQLGHKSLLQVVHFRPMHQQMVAEAAERIAEGVDPGVIPARFLVGAARWALDHRLASPAVIAKNFYEELRKR